MSENNIKNIKKQILAYNSQFIPSHFNEFKLAISFLINNNKFNLYTPKDIIYTNNDIEAALNIINQSKSLKIEILENYESHIKIFDFLFEINQIFNYIPNIGANDIILGQETLFAFYLENEIKIKNNIAKITIKSHYDLNIYVNFSKIYKLNFKNNKNSNFIILKQNINKPIYNFENLTIYLINDINGKISIYYKEKNDVF